MVPGSFPSPEPGESTPNSPAKEELIDEQPTSSKKHSSNKQHHHPSSQNMANPGNRSDEHYPNFIDHLVASYPADDRSEEACRTWLRLIFTPLRPDIDYCKDLHLTMVDIERFYKDKNMKQVLLYFLDRGIAPPIAKRASLDVFCAIAQRHIIAGQDILRGHAKVWKYRPIDIGLYYTILTRAAALAVLLSAVVVVATLILLLILHVYYALLRFFRALAIYSPSSGLGVVW
ncbi:hypothetical protein CPLU01_03061 [Colletotrichum plurivorum]|uniref:Uncharacterized protein n=1 Tax=Colletotrichum plurivorum TaxID=2175906 RepID=A0A8H6NKX7_9PEZI|nr:hypothetical protein CPLU01_03061 [Colletotrichum plurivorum]